MKKNMWRKETFPWATQYWWGSITRIRWLLYFFHSQWASFCEIRENIKNIVFRIRLHLQKYFFFFFPMDSLEFIWCYSHHFHLSDSLTDKDFSYQPTINCISQVTTFKFCTPKKRKMREKHADRKRNVILQFIMILHRFHFEAFQIQMKKKLLVAQLCDDYWIQYDMNGNQVSTLSLPH